MALCILSGSRHHYSTLPQGYRERIVQWRLDVLPILAMVCEDGRHRPARGGDDGRREDALGRALSHGNSVDPPLPPCTRWGCGFANTILIVRDRLLCPDIDFPGLKRATHSYTEASMTERSIVR